MANTTFTGPIRAKSINGFQSVTVTNGVETTFGKLIGTHLQIDSSSANQASSDFIVGKNGSPENTVNPFAESSTQLFPLGTKLIYNDRVFAYALMGAGAVTAGKLLQTKVAVANHRDIAVQAAAAAGDTTVTVTLGATAAAANLYAEGYLHINDVAGQGQLLKIASHPAGDSSGNMTVTLYDAIATALTTSSKADLIANKYSGLIVAPTAETGSLSGVTAIDMTAAYYGWVQIEGPCSILTDGTLVLGHQAVRSDNAAGAVEAAPNDTYIGVGDVMVLNGDADNSVINLNLS